MDAVLKIAGVRTGYADAQVIENATLSVERGEIYALLGKNGAGKTTLLRSIMGLHAVWAGTVEIAGADVTGWPSNRIARRGITYAPQERAFFPDLTVNENLRLGSLGIPEALFKQRRDRVVAYFPFVGDRLGQRAGSLSGGEQSMLKVTRALLSEPKLVLLDEISEGLQPLVIDRVRACLAAERQRGVSILLIEQNIDFVWHLAQRYGLMGAGRVLGQGMFTDPDARERVTAHLAI